jgi:RNA polymerase II subunit A small phosphatase-like protein
MLNDKITRTQKSSILVILDLDETLVYATKNKLEIQHDFMLEDYFVYKRPYFNEFISYIENNFTFAVWSSATDDYVLEMCEKLELSSKALFCWGRSKTTLKVPSKFDEDGDLIIDAGNHYFFIKRLVKLKKRGFSLEQILIIDDTPHKSKENYGNAIYPTEFLGNPQDNELLLLIDYLDKLKFVENVRIIEKRNWKNFY